MWQSRGRCNRCRYRRSVLLHCRYRRWILHDGAGGGVMHIKGLVLICGVAIGHSGADVPLAGRVENLPEAVRVGAITIGARKIERPSPVRIRTRAPREHCHSDAGVTRFRGGQEEKILLIVPEGSRSEYRRVLVRDRCDIQAALVDGNASGAEHCLMGIEAAARTTAWTSCSGGTANRNRYDPCRTLGLGARRQRAE